MKNWTPVELTEAEARGEFTVKFEDLIFIESDATQSYGYGSQFSTIALAYFNDQPKPDGYRDDWELPLKVGEYMRRTAPALFDSLRLPEGVELKRQYISPFGQYIVIDVEYKGREKTVRVWFSAIGESDTLDKIYHSAKGLVQEVEYYESLKSQR